MNLNFVNPDDLRVNDDLQFDCVKVGPDQNHPIITVDNVLANPDQFIKNIVEKAPAEFNDLSNPEEVFPGYQAHLSIGFSDIQKLVTLFINKYTDFNDCVEEQMRFSHQINIMYTDVKCKRLQLQPHVDPAMFAYVLYLNPEEECKGGTSFYEHKKCGIVNMENVDKRFKRTENYWNYKEWQYDFYNQKKDDEIELDTALIEDEYVEELMVPMKFNRLVIYPSYVWHHAVVRPGWFKDNPRVSMSGFVAADYFL